MSVATLTTARLQLRAWRSADRQPFAALNADPVVMEHFPEPLSWGLGYATEGAAAVVTYARDVLALSELVSFTATTNTRSQAVMRRIGMAYDGTFEHPALVVGHRLRRHVLYRLPLT